MARNLSDLSPAQRAQLARRLQARADTRPQLRASSTHGDRSEYPMGLDQERLWVLDRLDEETTTYNISFGIQIRGDLDLDLLKAGLGDLVARHDLLRSTMHGTAAQTPLMRVHQRMEAEYTTQDISDLGGIDRDRALAGLIRAHTHRPFDLENGPLLRVLVVRTADRDHQVVETMHHAVTDQWSYVQLNRQLFACYRDRLAGHAPPEEPGRIQFGDFAIWQRDRFSGAVAERAAQFWRGELEGAPGLAVLPYDGNAEVSSREGRQHYFLPDEKVSRQFCEMARQTRVTLATALLAAYAAVLFEESGGRDLVVGVPSATRDAQTSDMIGFLLTNVPMRMQIPDDATPATLLDVVSRTARRVADYRDTPFGLLVDAVQPGRSPHRYPVVQTMHLVLDFADANFDVPGLEVYGTVVDDGVSPMDITVGWWHTDGILYGRLEYRTALFHPRTIQRLEDRLLAMLARFVDHPDRPLQPGATGSPQRIAAGAIGRADMPGGDLPIEAADTGSALVETINRAWTEVMGRPPTPGRGFFADGGSSLQAVRLAQALRREGVRVSVRDLFLHDTPVTLAAALDRTPATTPVAVSGVAGPETDFATSAQQDEMIRTAGADLQTWTHTVVLHAGADVDGERVRDALSAVVAAHPALCLKLTIAPAPAQARWSIGVDWSWDVAPGDADDEEIVAGHVATMNLREGRLLAATWVAGEPGRLLLTANHLVIDGVSWMVVVEDLAAAYGGSVLRVEEGSYADYSTAQADAVVSESELWLSQVSPGRSEVVPGRLAELERVSVSVDLPAQTGASEPALLAATAIGLSYLSGESDSVVVDVVTQGRPRGPLSAGSDPARGVGFYATFHPLRIVTSYRDDPALMAQETRRALSAIPHEGLGWSILTSSQRPETQRSLLSHYRPWAVFNVVGSSAALHESTDGLFVATSEHGRPATDDSRADHAISVQVRRSVDQVTMEWHYDPALFSAAAVRAAAERTGEALDQTSAALSEDDLMGLPTSAVNELFADLKRRLR